MSTSKPERRGDLGERLVDAALSLLAEQGAEAISLRGVASRVGVSAMAPYRHYADKEALLAAVAARGFTQLNERVHAAIAGVAPDDAPIERAVAYVGFARANPALFRLMYGPRRSGDHPELTAARAAVYATMTAWARTEGDDSGPSPWLLGYWSLMHGLASLFLDGQLDGKGLGSDDEAARRVVRALLRPDPGESQG